MKKPKNLPEPIRPLPQHDFETIKSLAPDNFAIATAFGLKRVRTEAAKDIPLPSKPSSTKKPSA